VPSCGAAIPGYSLNIIENEYSQEENVEI